MNLYHDESNQSMSRKESRKKFISESDEQTLKELDHFKK